MKNTLPAGTYYIGDPCYAISDALWDTGFYEKFFDGIVFEVWPHLIWGHSTAIGDGTFNDQFGRDYPVDSGLIAVLPIDFVKSENKLLIKDGQIVSENDFAPGHFVTFDEPFKVKYVNGLFCIWLITIDTGTFFYGYYPINCPLK